MAYLLGIDTGGTYTDAVVIDENGTGVVAKAKALTSRPDLARGVGEAIDAVLEASGVAHADIGMVSLSTTLATNALVEGQGGAVALVLIGFAPAELERAGLAEAMGRDPALFIAGGHDHAGREAEGLDEAGLQAALADLPEGITGIAVAGKFATRNPAHEIVAARIVSDVTGLPVTASHHLSAALGGPKRALTAVLNARLVGLIARLIAACQTHLADRGIAAPLMVVRGDGSLMPVEMAVAKPIETILSGPAASIAGAAWLTGEADALVSDIGGTTTDVCLLRDGRPAIDPAGALVGGFRTMVEAVAMRTTGLGGDSEVHLGEGLRAGLRLGPGRIMPVALLARDYPALVHPVLDRALNEVAASPGAERFAVPLWADAPMGLDKREAAVAERLGDGPAPLARVLRTQTEGPALGRLIARGEVILAGVTPSDAAHVLGLAAEWDGLAAEKALAIFARRRTGSGERVAQTPEDLARMIVDQVTEQSVDCLLRASFAEDDFPWEREPDLLARHPLTRAGLERHRGLIAVDLRLGVPVIGLGASAASYYAAVGNRLGTRMIVPEHADVANAIGAVVGQVSVTASGSVTVPGPGRFSTHSSAGVESFGDAESALAALEQRLSDEARGAAIESGIAAPRVTVARDIKHAAIEGTDTFVSADMTATATGRPRIARSEALT